MLYFHLLIHWLTNEVKCRLGVTGDVAFKIQCYQRPLIIVCLSIAHAYPMQCINFSITLHFQMASTKVTIRKL